MDVRRSCAFEYIKPYSNSDKKVKIRWVFTTSPCIGIPCAWGSRLYEDSEVYSDPYGSDVGVFQKPSSWSDGWSGLLYAHPAGYCGDETKMQTGFDITSDPGLPTNEHGLGTCCGGVFIYGHLALGGHSPTASSGERVIGGAVGPNALQIPSNYMKVIGSPPGQLQSAIGLTGGGQLEHGPYGTAYGPSYDGQFQVL